MVAPSEDHDRPRGILSPADREYLVASDGEREENYSRSARTQRERAIRERAANAFMDFSLLSAHLDASDRAQIFEESELDIRRGIHGMLAFLYQHATDPPPGMSEGGPLMPPERQFEDWLERSIHRVQTNLPPRVAGNVEIRPVEVDLEIQNLEELDARAVEQTVRSEGIEVLTENELLFLLWLGRRGEVADMDFIPGTDLGTVIAELTDRIDDGWGLRGQVILDPRAYHDDADRAERAERRERYQDATDEREEPPDVPPGGDPWTGQNTDEES